jgi:hypothetical protein
MIVLYKNKDDSMELHTGTLMTSIEKLETAIYCDVIPLGHIETGELDWKNRHIQDVGMEYVLAIAANQEALERGMPEYFL